MFFYLKKHRYGQFVALCLLLGLLMGCSVPRHAKGGEPMDQQQSDPTDSVSVENPEDVRIFEQQFGHYRGADLYGLSGWHSFVSRDDESFTTEHWDGQDAVSQILHPDMYTLSQTTDDVIYRIWIETAFHDRITVFIYLDIEEKQGWLTAFKELRRGGYERAVVSLDTTQYEYYSRILDRKFQYLGQEEQDVGYYSDGMIATLEQAKPGEYARYEVAGLFEKDHPASYRIFKHVLRDIPLDVKYMDSYLYPIQTGEDEHEE